MARPAVRKYNPDFFFCPVDESYSGIQSTNDYYPFGSALPGRGYDARSYKFGFNGQEKNDDVAGDGNHLDFSFRGYDPRIGRFWSVDPLYKTYPFYSPYIFSGSSPIAFIDLDGLERVLAISFAGISQYRIGVIRSINNADISSKVLTTDPANQMVDAFKEASSADKNGIGFVAIFGHGSPNNMWGETPNYTKDDLSLLQSAIEAGDVSFTDNAIIYIGNCNAGTNDRNMESFAQKLADITGASVIAGSTDEWGPEGRGSVSPDMDFYESKEAKYTMAYPSLDNFRLFNKGSDPTNLGGKISLTPWLNRAKELPINKMETIPAKEIPLPE